MTIVRLKADVGYCELNRSFIFLDVMRDRYVSITPDLEAAFRRICASGEGVEPHLALLLLQTGLFEAIPKNFAAQPSRKLITPSRAITVPDVSKGATSKFIVHWARAISLLAVFHGFARRKSLKNSIDLARSLSNHPLLRIKNGNKEALLTAFGFATLLFRRKDRCLPDALALFSLLAASGYPVQITFGVRRLPFQAHCWVQQDDVVLGQGIENVQAFCPILAVA
ncbi:lasso peptide biosynthesis B2 protein [Sphingobium yanoikuyae]|uniref:Lasso peptide biosynthesis B2 protein n=1 Tax=Sphingobium yanoikuyae TaxID=13690 RepID=A0A6M4G6I0_SPHYA|nr:lasso peptide biosynthesis B2 protein [Sphingobium yanoikuyae]QJR02174.1 lasso peptide biosynthesis B2 protein [Sphingobium yanoikuyae]